jgi:hypothetical protein
MANQQFVLCAVWSRQTAVEAVSWFELSLITTRPLPPQSVGLLQILSVFVAMKCACAVWLPVREGGGGG